MTTEIYPSKKFLHSLLTIFFLLLLVGVSAQQTAQTTTYNGNSYGFYQYKPVGYDPSIQYPLIIFLHGMGERGDGSPSELLRVLSLGIPNYIEYRGETMTYTYNGVTKTFLVLSPQLGSLWGTWQPDYIDAMLDYATHNLSVDPNRIYLTGISLGGGGCWKYTTTSAANAARFAAIAPMCGSCDGSPNQSDWCNLAHSGTAIRAFHAQDDNIVGVGCTEGAINAVNQCSPTIPPLKTIYSTGGHFMFDQAYYDRTTPETNLNVFEWFLSHPRNNDPCATNAPPTATAGNNETIYSNTYTLSSWGSTDPEGGPLTFTWEQTAGPTVPLGPYPAVTLNNLQPAVYSFKLTAKDNCNKTGVAFKTITVETLNCSGNNAPHAEAGPDIVNTDEDHYMFSSWGSHDHPEDQVLAYEWSWVSGPNNHNPPISGPNYAVANVYGLQNGQYVYQLKVTDICGLYHIDQITINVALTGNRARTQVAESSRANAFRMYPNPVANRLYIELNASLTGKLKISVSDISGRTVRTFELQAATLKNGLDLAGLKQGVYMLQIESDGKKWTQKFVKK